MSYRSSPYAPYAFPGIDQQRGPLVVMRPAAALPQTAQAPIFEVHDGPVLLHQVVGKLTVAADGTVTNLTVVADPDSGVADVALNTATAITSRAVGTLMAPGVAGIGAALQLGGAVSGLNQPVAADIGNVELLTSASNAAARAYWLCMYEPLVPGAYVTPVLPTAGMRGLDTRPVGPIRRIRRRAAVVPATAQAPILQVTGGPILLWALVGKITTAMNGTVTNLTTVANPTSGLADVNLNTATAITSLAVGNLFSLQLGGIGAFAQTGGAAQTLRDPVILDIGTVDLLTSATNPGAFEWTALWQPLHPAGRLIVA